MPDSRDQKTERVLLKAVLVHSAVYTNYRFADPSSAPFADNEQGWGRVSLRDVLAPDAPGKALFLDEKPSLATGQSWQTKVRVGSNRVHLRVTLVYTDFPGENLINNLNLIVTDPTGKFHLGNDFSGAGTPDSVNNVEGVVIQSPAAGEWTVNVVASEVQQGPQPFALVISGADVALAAAVPASAVKKAAVKKSSVKKAAGTKGASTKGRSSANKKVKKPRRS